MSAETIVTDAPAVIDDTIPGGARYFHNLGDEPIWIESRAELKRIMEARGLVFAERNTYSKHDASPWATRTHLKIGATDPFLPQSQRQIAEPSPLVTPDGAPFVSTHTLDYQTASALRTYFSWVVRAGYEPELFCGDCSHQSRTAKITFDIDEDAIELTCACRRIVYAGSTKFARIAPTFPPPTPDAVAGIVLGPARAVLSQAEVETLRAWKAVLIRLHLQEALRCNRCYEANRSDGVRAAVTTAHVHLECRCRCYNHAGLTF